MLSASASKAEHDAIDWDWKSVYLDVKQNWPGVSVIIFQFFNLFWRKIIGISMHYECYVVININLPANLIMFLNLPTNLPMYLTTLFDYVSYIVLSF
jgi:hypothetical protein